MALASILHLGELHISGRIEPMSWLLLLAVLVAAVVLKGLLDQQAELGARGLRQTVQRLSKRLVLAYGFGAILVLVLLQAALAPKVDGDDPVDPDSGGLARANELSYPEAIGAFRSAVAAADPDQSFVSSVSDGDLPTQVHVTVTD